MTAAMMARAFSALMTTPCWLKVSWMRPLDSKRTRLRRLLLSGFLLMAGFRVG
jgi:hypothetical protein